MREISIKEIAPFIKALHCPTRWKIIELLQGGSKTSEEIFEFLSKEKKNLKKPALYYHLRELESVEIIALEEYKPSDQHRAPQKVWKLNVNKLSINLED